MHAPSAPHPSASVRGRGVRIALEKQALEDELAFLTQLGRACVRNRASTAPTARGWTSSSYSARSCSKGALIAPVARLPPQPLPCRGAQFFLRRPGSQFAALHTPVGASVGRGVPAEVAALVNDTVGTLAAASFADKDAVIGVILGTGTNACYVERKCAGTKVDSQSGEMIVNTEWGNFAAPSLPMLDADRIIDHGSVNPGALPPDRSSMWPCHHQPVSLSIADCTALRSGAKAPWRWRGAEWMRCPLPFLSAQASRPSRNCYLACISATSQRRREAHAPPLRLCLSMRLSLRRAVPAAVRMFRAPP